MDISDIKKEDDINGSFNISNVTENNGTAQNSITDVNKLLGFVSSLFLVVLHSLWLYVILIINSKE